MKVIYFKWVSRFSLFTALVLAVAGCGGAGSPATSGTGGIAAKLVWNSSGKTTGKVLQLAPAGVLTVKIIVSAADMATISQDFAASAGSGTINGIPAGTGRLVKVQGLDAGGVIRFQGLTSNITIVAGQVADAGIITMTAPVTTASPVGGTYNTAQSVTLTSNTPATIFYTTSGVDPTTGSTSGASPLTISIPTTATLKFFAIDSGFANEAIKTEDYTITPTGSLTVTF